MATYRITDEQLLLLIKGKGQTALSGNGSLGTTTPFTINHGLSGITNANVVSYSVMSPDAANIKYVTVNSTQISIYYNVAPMQGTGNVIIGWVIY